MPAGLSVYSTPPHGTHWLCYGCNRLFPRRVIWHYVRVDEMRAGGQVYWPRCPHCCENPAYALDHGLPRDTDQWTRSLQWVVLDGVVYIQEHAGDPMVFCNPQPVIAVRFPDERNMVPIGKDTTLPHSL